MIKLILILFSIPAFAAPRVRWAGRPRAEVRAAVEALRECGVEGRVLLWRLGRDWHPHLLVTHLPARVGMCRAPWMFLHDRDMLRRVRDFTFTHEGLLLNLRALGGVRLVRGDKDAGFADLRQLEPAIGEAVLQLRADADDYRLLGLLRRFEDMTDGSNAKTEERFRSLGLPKPLLEPTVNFIREARVLAASARALQNSKRNVEFQMMDDGSIMTLPHPVVSSLYREQRLREVRAELAAYTTEFAKVYHVMHNGPATSLREHYDIYLGDALPPEDFRALGLERYFPRCAEMLKENVAVGF